MKEIEDFLKLQSLKVRNNVKIVTPEDIGQNFFLHVDKETPKLFTPQVSRRALQDEDISVPRSTVGVTIAGCLVGYVSMEKDFFSQDNGLAICALDFEYSLRPTAMLVPDVEESDEHWLVGYNKEMTRLIPRHVGKIFISEVTYKRNEEKKRSEGIATVHIEVETNTPLKLDDKIKLTKGHYTAKLCMIDLIFKELEKSEEETFNNHKRKSAVLLDETSTSIPLALKW